MNYITYITESMSRGTIGSYISVGIFALAAVLAVFGAYNGIMRGFSKSVIRFFTLGLSAFGALFGSIAISNLIVNLTSKNEADSVAELIESYAPGALDQTPEMIKPLLEEMHSETAVIFVMMLVCIVLMPLIFIGLFYLLKGITFFIYKMLAGLTGAISYGRGLVSSILGGVVGIMQGIAITAIIVIPISGLMGVAEAARAPLIENTDDPDEQIVSFYDTVIDDLADNPFFDTVDMLGGKTAYRKMVTVTVNGKNLNMADESIGAIKLLADALPLANPEFNYADPSEDEKQAFADIVTDIGDNELLATLLSDIMRGLAYGVERGSIVLPFEGTNKTFMDDVMSIFKTSDRDNVEGDLDMVVDVYVIMCDKGLLLAFDNGETEELRELLTDHDENGKTIIDLIMDRLNENERGKPIVHSFTKISLALMHKSMGLDKDATQLYEDVKDDLHTVLNHNRSDFETEEEYKEQVKVDLDKTLEENDLHVSDEVKQNMVDYIAENYGDHEGDITEDEINDALLSYYSSYAAAKNSTTEGTPEGGTADGGATEGGAE